MKLRIQDNSVRLRLSRPEVDSFAESGRVMAATSFGRGARLQYGLERTDAVAALTVHFEPSEILIRVPSALGRQWTASSEMVGMEAEQPLDGGGTLTILVEKDFQCLHKDAVDPDAFPNPLA